MDVFLTYDSVELKVVADDTDEDISFINDALNSEEMRPYWGRMRPLTVEEERERIQEKKSQDSLCLLIVVDDRNVGFISLTPSWKQKNDYKLDIWLIPSARQSGYGTKAAKAIINHAFEYIDCQRISAHLWATNEASQRLLESLDFLLEGEKRNVGRWEGEYQNGLYYGLTREDWKSSSVFDHATDSANSETGEESSDNSNSYDYDPYAYNAFQGPTYEQAVADIKNKVDTDEPAVLDAPCGSGGVLPYFVDEFDKKAKFAAVEKGEDECGRAEKVAEKLDLADDGCINVIECDILREDLQGKLQEEYFSEETVNTDEFDCIWISDGFSPGIMPGPQLISRLSEFLSDDGIIALYYGNWLRHQLLPGYSELEHRLCAAGERHWQTSVGKTQKGDDRKVPDGWMKPRSFHPEGHPEKAYSWLIEAGFESVELKTYTVTYSRTEDGDLQTQTNNEKLEKEPIYITTKDEDNEQIQIHNIEQVKDNTESGDNTEDGDEKSHQDKVQDRLEDIFRAEYLRPVDKYLSDADRRKNTSEQLVTTSDRRELKTIFDPESDEFLPDQPGYFCTVSGILVTAQASES